MADKNVIIVDKFKPLKFRKVGQLERKVFSDNSKTALETASVS